MKYAFILGREAALSTAELLTMAKSRGIEVNLKASIFSPAVAVLDVSSAMKEDFFHALGGSIKMGEVVAVCTAEELEDALAAQIEGLARESVDFGLSFYGLGPNVRQDDRAAKILPLVVKKRVKNAGMSVRVVLPKEGSGLTSVQVDKNNLITKGAEYLILGGEGRKLIARTMAVQAFEEFSARDYDRPGVDAKSGMLPPKLARLMINLAGAPSKTILDPFCGSGTVLMEASLLGWKNVLGSDVSQRAVDDSQKNMAWLKQFGGPTTGVHTEVHLSDVKDIPKLFKPASIDAIVSEPFLGPPLRGDESDQKIHFIYLELMGLYRRAFDAFAKVLKPGAPVVFVFPVFGNKHINLLREFEPLGFKAEALMPGATATSLGLITPVGLMYKRPDAKVAREIFRFRFKGKEA